MRMAEHGCLTVTIEAGRLQITLGELIKLSSGDVLELKPYPVELKLRVGENYIAEGILVEINGRVGVQITTMY